MNTLYWNVRGVKRQEPWTHVEELVLTHNPGFLCIEEPLIKTPNVLLPVLSKHGFSATFLHNNTLNRVGNIWLFWRESMSPTLVSLSEQQITVQMENYLMSFVHASYFYGVHRQLWLGCKVMRDGGAKFLNAAEIDEVTNVMTTMAKEKSRVSYALHGERNSAYFHATIKMRQFRAQIIEIKNREGVLLK
ncbi:hypothetical protein IFM89_001100 [Coptis chinensis]|uniref:Endonuclease/exonuclease/phosphatase domain-containing protein n=1 Tax=Coptis chinensis TaxID=261450 RepID=A0A835LQ93_9MAGN|nr:hypothetical protein IFM89_001100 [Coptis chinensis]